jgi:NADPH:quinone reductase-like Zn-dependent oxidoreductase
MSPSTMKQWVVQDKEHGFDGLVYQPNAAVPKVGEYEVLVKLEAASLNYRDLVIPQVRHCKQSGIPSLRNRLDQTIALRKTISNLSPQE